MTETHDTDTPDATAVPPPAQPDIFMMVLDLVRLVADPTGCTARIAELQAEQAKTAKALRQLEFARQSHDRAIAKDHAELAQLAATARKCEVAARTREAVLADKLAKIDEFERKERLSDVELLPGGMARSIDRSPRSPDPHYGRQPAPAAEDETELVPVPGHGQAHTLTQSKPRRSMRRGVDG
jgi:hypothetical protein